MDDENDAAERLLWYVVPVNEEPEVAVNRFHRGFCFSKDGEIYKAVSGEFGLQIVKVFGPNAEETRQSLLEMRRRLKWSRAQLAAVLGVPKETLRRWETGARNPCGAARRLIWFMESLLLEPARLLDLPSLLAWGKI